jgi:hypothetical protein
VGCKHDTKTRFNILRVNWGDYSRRIARYNIQLKCCICGGTLRVGDSVVRKRRKMYHQTCWENSFLDIPDDILEPEDIQYIETGSIPVSSTLPITTSTILTSITFGVRNMTHAHLNQKHWKILLTYILHRQNSSFFKNLFDIKTFFKTYFHRFWWVFLRGHEKVHDFPLNDKIRFKREIKEKVQTGAWIHSAQCDRKRGNWVAYGACLLLILSIRTSLIWLLRL